MSEILWNSSNPQGSASPIVTASHDKNNVRIVWWYNILTAEFRYSKTSTALHCDKKFIDIFNDIGSRRSWLQGRVFSHCGKIYTLIYMFNHKAIPSDTLKNLLFKLNSCLNDDEQIVSVFDENGDNLSDMFESKSLASDPKEFLACVESFSSYGYKIPDDPETLIYDFYLMSTLPFPKDTGLATAFTEAKEKLYTYLKESMQNVLLFSIFLEFTHIDTLTKSDEFSEYFRDKGVPEFPNRFLAISNDSEDGLNFCRRLIKEFSGSIPIISAIADSFEDLAWPINFGGKAWRDITKAYISLYTTPKTDLGMLQVWIDRIFDLEHNTGKLVDKTNFFDVDGDTGWLRVALSFKFFSRSAFEFLDKASLDLVRLTTAILKDVYGWTYKDWIAKKTHGGSE